MYFFVAELWTAVWTLSQIRQPLDLNSSEMTLFLLALAFMLLVLGYAHWQQGALKLRTARLLLLESLVRLESSKNFKEFYLKLDFLRLKHRVGCEDSGCICRRLEACSELNHKEAVSFLQLLLEQTSREVPDCFRSI